MASCDRNNILERARKAKYFSIILNCTQNFSHREQMKGYKPVVTNPQNCKKLVSHFIQLSKQRFILCQTSLTVTLTVQCCNLVNFSGTKNKGYFIFNFTLKYLSFSMLWVSHLWLVTLQMSFTLRFVDACESDLIVQEHFIAFQETEETTGQLLCYLY
jgi:hypothetical protein